MRTDWLIVITIYDEEGNVIERAERTKWADTKHEAEEMGQGEAKFIFERLPDADYWLVSVEG